MLRLGGREFRNRIVPRTGYIIESMNLLLLQKKRRDMNCTGRGGRGVMVIVTGNGHGDTSSNPGRE